MHKLFKARLNTEFPTRERCSIVELMNDAEFPAFSVARCRVEPDVTTELHSLQGTQEVYVVIEGYGVMDDGRAEGRAIGPMDSIQVPANYPQRVTNTGDCELVFLAICSQRFVPEVYLAHEGHRKVDPQYSASADHCSSQFT